MSESQGGMGDRVDGAVGGAPSLPEEVVQAIDQVVSGGELGAAQRRRISEAGGDRKPPQELQKILELHVCMGLNACQGHDRPGTAPMAGMGECATAFHVCHGSNECRGQGGCGYVGSDAALARPGDQACRWNGSCASPINVCRVFSGGPAKGKSVWKLARELFETRMYTAGIPFGPSPGEGYPDAMVPPYERETEPRTSS